ncbi:hypothetical protein RRF57_000216 [Xylaria bambusicola]|uniref:Uncharacterized protein n=1 Tax=Xylaria bambusicola TaxID=326684 RepID=A0AAN7YTZ2_9PEZI
MSSKPSGPSPMGDICRSEASPPPSVPSMLLPSWAVMICRCGDSDDAACCCCTAAAAARRLGSSWREASYMRQMTSRERRAASDQSSMASMSSIIVSICFCQSGTRGLSHCQKMETSGIMAAWYRNQTAFQPDIWLRVHSRAISSMVCFARSRQASMAAISCSAACDAPLEARFSSTGRCRSIRRFWYRHFMRQRAMYRGSAQGSLVRSSQGRLLYQFTSWPSRLQRSSVRRSGDIASMSCTAVAILQNLIFSTSGRIPAC